jgi:hypothetical protein
MARNDMPGRLERVRVLANRRLDAMHEVVPAPKRQADPVEYMARATQAAQVDPVFRQELEAALTQYRRLGG